MRIEKISPLLRFIGHETAERSLGFNPDASFTDFILNQRFCCYFSTLFSRHFFPLFSPTFLVKITLLQYFSIVFRQRVIVVSFSRSHSKKCFTTQNAIRDCIYIYRLDTRSIRRICEFRSRYNSKSSPPRSAR